MRGPGFQRAEAVGCSPEKKSLHATERDSEANRQRRKEFVERIRAISPERLIFLDESEVTTSMTRLYGRRVDGGRIHEATPGGHWKILTILAAMRLGGVNAAMTIEEATDTDIFLAYVEHVLCPTLGIGDVVVMMDNLSPHTVQGVRERIEARGAEVLYLPPYSPDLNPIEKAWAKIKQYLRSTRARSKEDLDEAISEAFKLTTPDNAQAWSRHSMPALHQPWISSKTARKKGLITRSPFLLLKVCLIGLFLAGLLAIALAGQGLLHAHLLAWLHVIRVPLDFLDDVFLLHLALETAQCILKRFAFLNLYFCQKRFHPPTLRLDTS